MVEKEKIAVSLIASSNRPGLYYDFFNSLNGTTVPHEVVFVGDNSSFYNEMDIPEYLSLRYIKTNNIKPAQCYEIARREAKGEVVVWVADDCEFPNDVIGKAYRYWKSQNKEKLILSIQTRESGYGLPEGQLFDMTRHRLRSGHMDTPLMAPIGMMSRKFLDDLGGFDRRFVCGQYENKAVLMALKEGGFVEIFGDEDCFVDIDHLGKSIKIGESKTEKDFFHRPFTEGYKKDREVLFYSNFEPYESEDILIKSQSNKGIWE